MSLINQIILLQEVDNKLFEIEKLPPGTLKTSPARPTFDFNPEAVIA